MLTIYHNGVSVGMAGGNPKPVKRGSCKGWTPAVARRNLRFLWSVDVSELTGIGFSFTFTVSQDVPETAQKWASMVQRLAVAFNRGTFRTPSALRYHWVTEWQMRGAPHLHGAVYFEPSLVTAAGGVKAMCQALENVWAAIAGLGHTAGQHVSPIFDALGWSQYCAKHAARGAKHAQRSADVAPEQWEGRTGRMWGKGGSWPIVEPVRIDDDRISFHMLRRLIFRYKRGEFWRRVFSACKAGATEEAGRAFGKGKQSGSPSSRAPNLPNPDNLTETERAQRGSAVGRPQGVCLSRQQVRELRFLKTSLRCPDRALSSYRGASTWVPAHVAARMARACILEPSR